MKQHLRGRSPQLPSPSPIYDVATNVAHAPKSKNTSSGWRGQFFPPQFALADLSRKDSLSTTRAPKWRLRTNAPAREAGAPPSPTQQTSRYLRGESRQFSAATEPSNSFLPHRRSLRHEIESNIELPAQPDNVYLRSQRVPHCTEPSPIRHSDLQLNECCNSFEKQPAPSRSKGMALTKSQRIIVLLAIDSVFFLIELVVGYAVHSLALVADSFHMLNDVLSLFVGLWAVKRAKTGRTTNYTYGWQRAETLGALVNGVFLVALCLSIFLDAIQRFVEPQVVSNPKLVLIVGCLGLASNILGLFLFHDHGHSHGGHGDEEEDHSHSHDAVKNAEEGHSHSHSNVQWADESTRLMSDHGGTIEDVLPTVRVAGFQSASDQTSDRKQFAKSDESNTTVPAGESSSAYNRKSISSPDKQHRRRASFFTSSIDDMPIHPAGRRDEIIHASQFNDDQSDTNTEDAPESPEPEQQPLNNHKSNGKATGYGSFERSASHEYSHAAHKHRQPRTQTTGGGGHGHSHGDLNMRGVFLHVMGDALGNVGVIASALIIWLAKFPGRYYFDPAISLVITIIILYTAIPLCTAAARILLQAVPMGMSIDEIRADIEDLKGIKSAHHIHVWQLSDTKLIASLHVKISPEIKDAGTEGYMRLAREIQQCLKEYGIRSSTIQPEFELDGQDGPATSGNDNTRLSPRASGTKTASLQSVDKVCMLDCEDAGEVLAKTASNHDHDHDHDHSHDDHDHAHDHSNGKNKSLHQH